jgi:hypothetical protein
MFPINYKIVEGHDESLGLFINTPTNTAVQNVEEIIYRPVSQLSSVSTYLEFSVPGTSKYLDLSKTRLYLQLKITRQDGSPLDETDNVALINLPGQSIFSQVDATLNQMPITKIPAPLYAYKSYLDTLLWNGEEPKETWLQAALYFTDSPGQMDNFRPLGNSDDAGANAGLVQRQSYTDMSKICELESSLSLDFFQQSRYLLNNVPMHLKLWQAPDAFRLMGDTTRTSYKVQIVDAQLKITAVSVMPEIILAHEDCLTKTPALYPMFQSDFKVFSIARGDLFFSADNIWGGSVPSKAIIALVDAESYNGSYKKNPFHMHHANLTSLSFTVDGVSKPASKPITPDYENDHYTEAFLGLYTASNMMGKNTGCDLSHYAYKHGYTIYHIDLDGHHSQKYLPLPKKAHIRIEAKFGKPLTDSMNLIVYGKFPTTVKIDKARTVIV